MNEEAATSSTDEAVQPKRRSTSTNARTLDRYTESALMENQPRLVDFVPIRYSMVTLVVLAGLAVIAGILSLHHFVVPLATEHNFTQINGLRLNTPGNLESWFNSTVLWIAALFVWIIYSLRKHRMDDYRGRYRTWLWAAPALLLLSIDQTAGLRFVLQDGATQLAQSSIYADGTLWWVIAWGTVILAVGGRLLLDSKHCLGSTTILLLAATLWGFMAAGKIGVIPFEPLYAELIISGAQMLAYFFTLLGLTLYTRYTILDIQGKLHEKKPAKSKKTVSTDNETSDVLKIEKGRRTSKTNDRRTDLDPVETEPKVPFKAPERPEAATIKVNANRPDPVEPSFEEDEFLESSGRTKLSRAERKKQRRNQQEHRKAG